MNNCQGCDSLNKGGGRCDWLVANETNEGGCPCTNCIVKMICGNACEEYRERCSDRIICSSKLERYANEKKMHETWRI